MSADRDNSARVKRLLEEMDPSHSVPPDADSGDQPRPESLAALSTFAKRLSAAGLLISHEPQYIVAGRGKAHIAVLTDESEPPPSSSMPALRFPARLVELFPDHVLKDVVNDINLLEALSSG